MDRETGAIREFSEAEIEKMVGSLPANAADLLKAMDEHGFIPVAGFSDSDCKKCHGLGHLGRNLTTHHYVPCTCVQKKDPDA